MIKNFIYLDEYKMYSLSSQIFEGITEYVSNSSNEETESNVLEKLGEGKVLADILKKNDTTQEKKYLHDYSYTVFEKHLIENDKVLDINKTENFINSIGSKSFIKITGKVIFNDIENLSKSIKEHNKMANSLIGVQLRASLNKKSTKKEKSSINQIIQNEATTMDEQFLKDLGYLLDFGFGNQLEIQLEYNDNLFSTNLNEKYLREDKKLVIKKYGQKTEKEFTIFGIVTQYQKLNKRTMKENPSNNFKIALMNAVLQQNEVKLSFTGKLENEIMIDPIAIYTEL